MTPRLIRHFCKIDSESETMLERAMTEDAHEIRCALVSYRER
jgi:hypothetical protein